jgi:HEAT repeat protein
MPESVKTLVNHMPTPQPNERGILSKVDRDVTLKAIAELQAGGAEAVTELVAMLVEPGKGSDHQARYAIHALALYVCGLGGRERNESDRKSFAETLAKALDSDRPAAVKEFVIRELQVCGGAEVVAAIGKCLAEKALTDAAASALAAIGGTAVAAEFRRVLAAADARQRLIMVQNLGVLRDKESLKALAAATSDADVEVRTAACWALANIGDPAGIEACLAAAEKAKGYEHIQAGKSRLLFAERLREAGNKNQARQVLGHLKKTSGDDSEAYLREIADRELAEIG